jgi:hypothetical protein
MATPDRFSKLANLVGCGRVIAAKQTNLGVKSLLPQAHDKLASKGSLLNLPVAPNLLNWPMMTSCLVTLDYWLLLAALI